MSTAVQILAFITIAFGYSLALYRVLRSEAIRPYLVTVLALLVSVTPLLIGSRHVAIRAAACVLAVELLFKMLDFARCYRMEVGPEKSFRNYLAFLIPFPTMSVSFAHKSRTDRLLGREAYQTGVKTAAWLLVFLSSVVLVKATSQIDAVRASFVLDHVLKVAIFVVAIESLSRALLGFEHLAGYRTTPLMRNIILSKSIGDFWCRYNTRVHQWFFDNLYRPFGGNRYPVRCVFFIFFVSALLHEVSFAIATSHFTGYQFVFFMIQAPAVCLMGWATRYLPRRLASDILLRAITIVWMWVTSLFFFHGVHQVFPFIYVSKQWLLC